METKVVKEAIITRNVNSGFVLSLRDHGLSITLVRFYLNGSIHNSAVFYFSEKDVLTSPLVLCLVHDQVYESRGIHTKHKHKYNMHTLHNEV